MRILLIAALLVATAPLATAQVSFGLKGGLNVTDFGGEDGNLALDNEGYNTKLGGSGGVTVLLRVNPAIGVGLDALYSQKGARIDALDRTYSFDYVDVPVYVRLAVPLGDFLEGGVQLGGFAGIPVRASVSDIADTEIQTNTDLGALIGVDVGSGPYYVEARYAHSLTNVTDDDNVFNATNPEVQNRNITLSFGARF